MKPFIALALAAVITLPGLAHAAPADPYQKVYDAIEIQAHKECRGAGSAQERAMIDRMPINPHQRSDLIANAYIHCESLDQNIADLVYASLHNGSLTMDQVKACAAAGPDDITVMQFYTCVLKFLQR